jgi:surfeit locus 1 family protein
MNSPVPLLRALFSRRWLPATLLVLVAMAVMARLGVWQLDRLEQRRALNAQLTAVLNAPPLDLTSATLPDDISALRNRQVMARGEYDFARQMILLVQNWQGRAGVHLITPLRLAGSETAVLVDRGWIPNAESAEDVARQYDEAGEQIVTGVVGLTQALRRPATTAAPGVWQRDWYRVDIAAIQAQLPYPILPFYIQQTPAPGGDTIPPLRSEPEIDLSEGPHLGYALQWFTFSLIVGVGYLYFVRKERQGTQIIGALLAGLLWAASAVTAAQAHGGGVLQIGGAVAGPYQLTIWTSPSAVRAGSPLHVTVGVAGADGAPVLDAAVLVELVASQEEVVATAPATTAQSVNKLFYEADLIAPEEGSYDARVLVSGPAGQGEAGFVLAVQPPAVANWLLSGLAGIALLAAVLVYRAWRRQSARHETPARRLRPKPSTPPLD